MNTPSMSATYMDNLIAMRNFNCDVMNSILDEKNLKKDEEGAEQEKIDQAARRKGEKVAIIEPTSKKLDQRKKLQKDMQQKLKVAFKGTNLNII